MMMITDINSTIRPNTSGVGNTPKRLQACKKYIKPTLEEVEKSP